MKTRHLMNHIAVFFAWAINSALAFWVMVVVRNALLVSLAVFYVGESNPRAWRARFWDRAFFVFAGLALLIFLFASDGYLKDGIPKGDVLRRFARLLGVQLLILFPADLLTTLLQESLLGRFAIIVVIVELLGGMGLLAYSIWKDPRRKVGNVSQGGRDG
jgi:hypothetical protein